MCYGYVVATWYGHVESDVSRPPFSPCGHHVVISWIFHVDAMWFAHWDAVKCEMDGSLLEVRVIILKLLQFEDCSQNLVITEYRIRRKIIVFHSSIGGSLVEISAATPETGVRYRSQSKEFVLFSTCCHAVKWKVSTLLHNLTRLDGTFAWHAAELTGQVGSSLTDAKNNTGIVISVAGNA